MLKSFSVSLFMTASQNVKKRKKEITSEECMSASVYNWSCLTEAEMMSNFPGKGSPDRDVSKIEQYKCLPYFL